MTEQTSFTDEELTAYLDDEADPELRNKIENARESDIDLQAQLDRLKINTQQIESAFNNLLDHAPATVEIPEMPVQRRINTTLNKIAVAALVALIVGVGIGNKFSQDAKLDGWRGYVAAYHALYTEQTLVDIAQTNIAASDQLRIAAATIGKDISIDTLQASKSLSFKRSQVLGFKGKPLLQLSFVTESGEPVALCILKKPDLPDSQPKTVILEGMPATSWSKSGYDYILIGGSDTNLIKNAAQIYASKI